MSDEPEMEIRVVIDCPTCGQDIEYIDTGKNYLCERCGVLWKKKIEWQWKK